MIQFTLEEIITQDNLVHQGIFAQPAQRQGKKALLWVHGLTGKFYGDVPLMNMLADTSVASGLGFASFNNRGHDMITGLRRADKDEPAGYRHVTIGAGMETFEECVFDIDAAVTFLVRQGFTEIFLAGHSTGANKVCYYAAVKSDARVAGVVLAGPISDRLSQRCDKLQYQKNLFFAKTLIAAGKGDDIQLHRHFFPITPKRALSLFAPNTTEDVFNYGDTVHVLSVFAKITKPLMVILSGNDELADRPVTEIKQAFDTHTKSKRYVSRIIPDTTHGFEGKEKEFVSIIVKWAASL